jgi:hypothetical protein
MSDQSYIYVNTLLSDCQTITESFERVAQASGENFNLFTILGLETKEVATHSRFIAELLNPKGSHGRGVKFLELFLQEVGVNDFDPKWARVKVEHSFSGVEMDNSLTSGRIDIFIESNGRVIMIENKIWAYEQVEQLKRYKAFKPNGFLFYLTLKGEHSSYKGKYKPISYRVHIKNWLELCRREAVEAPLLRESITLYLNLVKKLTHQTINKEMEKEIVERVLRNPESLMAYSKLFSSYSSIIHKIRIDGIKAIIDKAAKDLGLDNPNYIGNFPDTNRYAGVAFDNPLLKSLNLKIGIHYEGNNGYMVMFTISSLDNNAPMVNEVQMRFKNAFNEIKLSPSFICYLEWVKYPNWAEWDMLSAIQFGDFKKTCGP